MELELLERVARAICKADGVDPDQRAIGLGKAMPEGQEYALWEARKDQAEAAITAMAGFEYQLGYLNWAVHQEQLEAQFAPVTSAYNMGDIRPAPTPVGGNGVVRTYRTSNSYADDGTLFKKIREKIDETAPPEFIAKLPPTY